MEAPIRETVIQESRGHGFGTVPVFLACVSAILGAIMFLRFGYAVGHVGLLGAFAIVLLGHMVTVPTALALSEIATNRKVEGGGEYYIISRSFGLRIGSAIGIARYLAETIEFSLYCIAFGEAFRVFAPWLATHGIGFDPRMVSLPIAVGLTSIMLWKGADLGIGVLYVVVAVVAAALVLFFVGKPLPGASGGVPLVTHVEHADPFFTVFAICFPAFTGMTQGVNLSGDLKNPARSIPYGTMLGTAVGFIIFLAVFWKLAASAPPEALATDELVMSRIAVWGPIIPIGLACATLSSAIGSILGSPRMLQAIARDRCFPLGRFNKALAKGHGRTDEPRAATALTGAIAIVVVILGDIDFVARLMSMFLLVSYGALCSISFLEHFAASPSYRPTFRSRWYISLVGAVMSFLMMFQTDPVYAVLAIATMLGLYWISRFSSAAGETGDLADLFLGVMGQLTRQLNVRLQRSTNDQSSSKNWRPSIITVSNRTFDPDRTFGAGNTPGTLKLLGWLCERHGFGTYLHHHEALLNRDTYHQSKQLDAQLLELSKDTRNVFVDTIVSPSYRTALAQTLQVPGVSGLENNSVLFGYDSTDPQPEVAGVVDSALFASGALKNLLFLRNTPKQFGTRQRIHIWLNWNDSENAPLMTLLAYILVGHKEWRKAEISIFAAFPADQVEAQRTRFETMMEAGRIQIRKENVRFFSINDGKTYHSLVESTSAQADLVVLGVTLDALAERGSYLLTRYPSFGETLFVCAAEHVAIE
ncbi:MAG TPA: amino acid permease [Kofleriaceae bacterium]|nr:amino acid permease [Kofleriaceae bacterium]